MSLIKVIIMGAYGLLMEGLISKFNKENCEIYVITGSKVKERKKHSQVIEEYYFEFDNELIYHIFDSTKADIAIFTGAYDPNFQWNKQHNTKGYIGGLYNSLICASRSGIKRYIYMSTIDVYDNAFEGLVDEESTANPTATRTLAIRNGESITLSYNQKNSMQTAVFRCSDIYGFCNDKFELMGFCTKLYIDIVDMKEPVIDNHRMHDYIHINDVANGIYKAATKAILSYTIYNICTCKRISEIQTLKLITELTGVPANVIYRGDTALTYASYSIVRVASDIGFAIKYSSEEYFRQYLIQLSNIKKSLIARQKRGLFNKLLTRSIISIYGWLLPYIGTICIFAIIQLIVSVTKDYTYVASIDFYLLYVILIAILFNKSQTILALLLCIISRLLFTYGVDSFSNILIDYRLYAWMLQLLVTGLGISYVRSGSRQKVMDNKEEIKSLNAELAEINAISYSNLNIKKIYESRLLSYNGSFVKVCNIISRLDNLEPDRVIFEAVNVVSEILDSDDVVIYKVERKKNYARLAASTPSSTHIGIKSAPLASFNDVYEEIFKDSIYINRSMDSTKPLLAGGIFIDASLEAIIMLWSLPFENNTLYHVNMFKVLLKLITQALFQSQLHIEESRLSRYVRDTSILTEKSFVKILEIQKQGSSTNLADYYLLEIIRNELTDKELDSKISPLLRDQDYLGLIKDKLYLLLTNTNEYEAQFVIKRLDKMGVTVRKEYSTQWN